MLAAQGAVGGVVHHEERDAILDIEVKNAHNMRVDERCNGLRFAVEVLDVGSVCQLGVQDFDGGLHVEAQVLAEIDLGETSASQEKHEAIVAQLLTYTIRHTKPTSFSSVLQLVHSRSSVCCKYRSMAGASQVGPRSWVPPQTGGWEAQNVVAGGGVVRGGALAAARFADPRFWVEPR